MKKEILSYVAGFIDGEGSINITVRQRKNFSPEYTLMLAIGQKDGETLDWIKENFGGNISTVKRDGSFFWYISNIRAYKMLKKVIPYMRYKKPQAKLAISLYEEKIPLKNKKVTIEETNRREKIREEIKKLHKTIIKSKWAGSTTKRIDA
jgi:hypothetical protein